MLFPTLYKIESINNTSENQFLANIVINSNHEIFKGHFPDNPVMPGVCMMQIIKEITEGIVGFELTLQQANNVKFMALINPEKTSNLDLELEIVTSDNQIKVKNTTSFNETVALKLSNIYIKK